MAKFADGASVRVKTTGEVGTIVGAMTDNGPHAWGVVFYRVAIGGRTELVEPCHLEPGDVKERTLVVYEIEHGGDLDAAHEALRAAGATRSETMKVSYEAETAVIKIGYTGELRELLARAEEEGLCL